MTSNILSKAQNLSRRGAAAANFNALVNANRTPTTGSLSLMNHLSTSTSATRTGSLQYYPRGVILIQRNILNQAVPQSVLRKFSTSTKSAAAAASTNNNNDDDEKIRLSQLISSHGLNIQMSRKSASLLIGEGLVTVTGNVVTDPNHRLTKAEAYNGVKVAGKLLRLPAPKVPNVGDYGEVDGDLDVDADSSNLHVSTSRENQSTSPTIKPMRTRVWLAHKLKGELVSEHDPEGRPSLMERLARGGVGKTRKKSQKGLPPIHLKPVGRLDMVTEGLILVTNDGKYKSEMELPSNSLHRTYRARVHGRITLGKLRAIRSGMEINGTYYKGMKVNLETNKGKRVKGGATNSWLRITCVEGKNRQIRKVLDHLGLTVTRLIRTSFGDYQLETIPPGMAIEVPVKPLESQKLRGKLETQKMVKNRKTQHGGSSKAHQQERASPVQWIRHT